jgi:hypothetical protein
MQEHCFSADSKADGDERSVAPESVTIPLADGGFVTQFQEQQK